MSDFYLGGYYLLLPAKRYDFMNKELVPEYFITVSECLIDLLVSEYLPSFNNKEINKNKHELISKYREFSKLSDEKIVELNEEVCMLQKQKLFGYDSVFTKIDIVRNIYQKYFKHLDNAKLISIGLNEIEYNEIIEQENILECNNGYYGLFSCLAEKTMITDGKLLGFDLLGYGHGYFHCTLCGGSEEDIYKKFGYKLNEYGLYDDYEEANVSSRYLDDSNGELAELALWQPWAIFEHETCKS